MFNAEQLGVHGPREGGDAGRFGGLLPKLLAEVAREQTTSGVAARIAKSVVVGLGARSARAYLRGAARGTLDLVAVEGAGDAGVTTLAGASGADDLPVATAVRLGRAQLTHAEGAPSESSGDVGATTDSGVVELALPLFAGAETIGAVSASFDELALEDCAALAMLSAPLGALLDGARLRGELARLDEIGRKREERMALVIHELRQPLQTVILGVSHLAMRSVDGEQRTLELLRSAGRKLDELVSDLSDTSFFDSGTFALRFASTDVAGLVEATVARLAPSVCVSVEGDVPLLDVDPGRIEQIMTNLLVNAQKYGRGEPGLRVLVVRQDRVVVVSVTNAGDGIAEDERARVFEPYYRGRACKSDTRGKGLGLAICRMLVEGHGGRIWTDGDSSHTRFSFSLPIPEVAEPRASETRRFAALRPAASDASPRWGAR